MDTTLFAEFQAWRESPTLDKTSPFLDRVYREDVGPCLDFTTQEVRRGRGRPAGGPRPPAEACPSPPRLPPWSAAALGAGTGCRGGQHAHHRARGFANTARSEGGRGRVWQHQVSSAPFTPPCPLGKAPPSLTLPCRWPGKTEPQACLHGSWHGTRGWAGAVACRPGQRGVQRHLSGEGQWLPSCRAKRHLWLCPLAHPTPSHGPAGSPGSPGAGVSLFLAGLTCIPLPLPLSPTVGSGPRSTHR